MRMYRGQDGTWFRTQAEGKASGQPFEPVEVPTDHKGLHAFLNSLAAPAQPTDGHFALEPGAGAQLMTEAAENMGLYEDRPYQNGDPTTSVMKSRDPMARFTCRACGTVNRPEPGR